MVLEYLQQLSGWDWMSLGGLLLILEVVGGGGYLLWFGLSAAAVAVTTLIFPAMPWEAQFIQFGILSVLTGVVWWQRQRKQATPTDRPVLNQRGSELLGREFVLFEAIQEGRGKIKAGDTLWSVSGPDSPVGARVRVESQAGLILHVASVYSRGSGP